MSFKEIALELSLKPFKQTDDAYIHAVCEQLFSEWRPLLAGRRTVSVMLWCADGSEILDYAGEMDAPFAWACYVGTANLPEAGPHDLPERSLHECKRRYIADPPTMTYGILKKIVATVKEVGGQYCPGARILVGETFDIGPEFAVSDFKYNRHPEICAGNSSTCNGFGFVDATACLRGDSRPYAAYPAGIPEGTPFGVFFGKQTAAFFRDMGFDYIWFSNGLGFSADPWDMKGKIFDGVCFHPEKLGATRQKVLSFWADFTAACPGLPIRVRGTNHSVGIDYASDGVPLYDIYRAGYPITPPPNSPWAAINGDYGLELMGHMTRIAALPAGDFMFRYYLHDPWWMNSPWYDRYDSSPTDIYLPMAVSRIDEGGKTRAANLFHILSADNSQGDMPPACVYEPLPHLLKAEKNAPDAPAPFIWVYPVREYTSAEKEADLREMYEGDRFIAAAINAGFPLNCTVCSDTFAVTPPNVYMRSVLLVPTGVGEACRTALLAFCRAGGRVIFYGSAAPAWLPPHAVFVPRQGDPKTLAQATRVFGYDIIHRHPGGEKSPVLTVHRADNAFFFSVYNPNTAGHTLMHFPLGAPILKTGETELVDGYAKVHFARSEHRECRFFVEQTEGVISCREEACVNMHYRRRIMLCGLRDATVCYFPESATADRAYVQHMAPGVWPDDTPVLLAGGQKTVDPYAGTYYKLEHLTGDYSFLMPRQVLGD